MLKHFRKVLNKFSINHISDIFLIITVAFVSVSSTLKLYFWHDDFSIVYIGRTGDCVFSWPYASYCSIFSSLEKIFKYSAPTYFAFAFFLFIFSALAFYFFTRQIYTRLTSLFLSLIYSTGFIGAGVFLEIYDSVTSFLSLGLLFLSLGVFLYTFRKKMSFRWVFLGTIVYVLSVIVLQARSTTYIFPLLGVVYFFGPREKRISLAIMVTLVHVSVCLVSFLTKAPSTVIGATWMKPVLEINFFLEIKEFFQTLSYIVLPENFRLFTYLKLNDPTIMLIRLIVGLLTPISFIWLFTKKIGGNKNRNIGLLALIWILFIYLPFGVRSDSVMWTTHRYLVYIFPGILLAWGLLSRYRVWFLLSLLMIIFNIYKVHTFLEPYVLSSEQRRDFYLQYNSLAKEIPKGAVIFFDYPREFSSKLGDFLRVGFLPSEASIATEKAVRYDNFNIFVADSGDFSNYISDHLTNPSSIYSYYYDGKTLFDTTATTRKLLKMKGSWTNISPKIKIASTRVVQNKEGIWCGDNSTTVSVGLGANRLIIPSKLSLDLIASTPQIPLPYSQNCPKNIKIQQAWRFLSYLGDAEEIMNKLKSIGTEKTEDNLFIKNIIDGDPGSYWTAGRRGWVNKERPVIHIEFKSLVRVSGLIIKSTHEKAFPTDFEVISDGQIVNHSRTSIDNENLIMLFDGEILTDSIDLKILRTVKGERPLINDISFIPPGHKDIIFQEIDQFQKYPTANIQTDSDLAALKKYFSGGVQACVEWDGKNYGKGLVNFDLFIDNKSHHYEIQLPAMGMEPIDLKIGCLNYPVRLNLNSARLSY